MQAQEAAEQHLRRFAPSLRCRGAIVNVGPFTCAGIGLADILRPTGEGQILYDADLDD